MTISDNSLSKMSLGLTVIPSLGRRLARGKTVAGGVLLLGLRGGGIDISGETRGEDVC